MQAPIREPAALFACVADGGVELLRLLLDRGADPNTEFRGDSLLHSAVKSPFSQENSAIVALLMERGANVNVKDKAGRSPLELARKQGEGPHTLNPHELSADAKSFDQVISLLEAASPT